ncbi:hypothetical protein CBS101457_003721 [Exobasidium rhododendri]|nr:hypothetical protein CBS101457_003721 [Exobasidium rhododendri]
MDAFQVRLEFLGLLRRLNASQQSIAKVVDYAIRYASTASEDIWDCVLSECLKTSLNARLNILFLMDALLLHIVDPIGFSSSVAGSGASSSSLSTANLAQAAMSYLGLATRDLRRIVLQGIVPSDNWDAVRLNATSTEKVLTSWKRLNIFDRIVLDEIVDTLQVRKTELSKLPSSVRINLSKQDVLRRIEEDRERQKILRQRAWILPAKSFYDSMPAIKPTILAINSTKVSVPTKEHVKAATTDALDVEFDYVWDDASDFNEDDLQKIQEDHDNWRGSQFDKVVTKEEGKTRELDTNVVNTELEGRLNVTKKRKADGFERTDTFEGKSSSADSSYSYQRSQSSAQQYVPPPRTTTPSATHFGQRMSVRPPRWSHQGGR